MSERSFLKALSDLGISEADFSNHDTWVLFHSLTATHGIVKTRVRAGGGGSASNCITQGLIAALIDDTGIGPVHGSRP